MSDVKKTWSGTAKARTRRVNASKRLENQLANGVKTVKKSSTKTEPLNDGDKKRIEKELNTLKNRM